MPFEDFRSIEFGICSIIDGQEIIALIPIDDSVRQSLYEMHETFYNTYLAIDGNPLLFEASEKYGQDEKLTIPLNNQNLNSLNNLYNQPNIPVSNLVLSEIANKITYYFAVFHHINGAKQIAVRRPSQFKGLLKKHNKLIQLVDDTLKVVVDDIFKLDIDFDFIIHELVIDILHPTGFTFIANIEEEILRTAADATRLLTTRIAFVNFNYLANYVGHSKAAAKLIASIKSREDLERTSMEKLIAKCQSLNVLIRVENEQIVPEDNSVIHFLQILDRREYDVDLTDDNPEIFVASSRKKIS
jgi:hypothetical protein